MKNLGFSDALVPLVLAGTKTVTRRGLSALKRYKVGDVCYVGEALVLRVGLGIDRPRYAVYRRDSELVPARSTVEAERIGAAEWQWKTRVMPSIWCPEWAARGYIRITDLRAERLLDITDEDALLEGVEMLPSGDFIDPGAEDPARFGTPRDAFLHGMWTRINGATSLAANPELARIAIEPLSATEARSA